MGKGQVILQIALSSFPLIRVPTAFTIRFTMVLRLPTSRLSARLASGVPSQSGENPAMCIKISVKRLGNHDYDWVLVFCCASLFSLSNPCPGNGRTQLSPTCLAPSNIGLT